MINEGVKELRKQFVESGKVPDEVFDDYTKADPSGTGKYLGWMLKQYTLNPERKSHVIDVAKLFDQQVKRKLITGDDSDIYRYTLEEADEKAQGVSTKKTKGDVRREIKSESKVVEETDRYLIVELLSHGASCFYGANTKWCISGRTSEYWDQYWEAGVRIYVVINKKENKKYAVAVGVGGKKEVFDEQDKSMKFESLKKKLGIR